MLDSLQDYITALRLGDAESPNYGLSNIAISRERGEKRKKKKLIRSYICGYKIFQARNAVKIII